MSSLADELLGDLEDDEPVQEEEERAEEPKFKVPNLPGPKSSLKRKAKNEDEDEDMSDGVGDEDDGAQGGLVLEGGVKPAEELDEEDVNEMELGAVKDVRSVAKLEGSRRMTDILKVCCPRYLIYQSNRSFTLGN